MLNDYLHPTTLRKLRDVKVGYLRRMALIIMEVQRLSTKVSTGQHVKCIREVTHSLVEVLDCFAVPSKSKDDEATVSLQKCSEKLEDAVRIITPERLSEHKESYTKAKKTDERAAEDYKSLFGKLQAKLSKVRKEPKRYLELSVYPQYVGELVDSSPKTVQTAMIHRIPLVLESQASISVVLLELLRSMRDRSQDARSGLRDRFKSLIEYGHNFLFYERFPEGKAGERLSCVEQTQTLVDLTDTYGLRASEPFRLIVLCDRQSRLFFRMASNQVLPTMTVGNIIKIANTFTLKDQLGNLVTLGEWQVDETMPNAIVEKQSTAQPIGGFGAALKDLAGSWFREERLQTKALLNDLVKKYTSPELDTWHYRCSFHVDPDELQRNAKPLPVFLDERYKPMLQIPGAMSGYPSPTTPTTPAAPTSGPTSSQSRPPSSYKPPPPTTYTQSGSGTPVLNRGASLVSPKPSGSTLTNQGVQPPADPVKPPPDPAPSSSPSRAPGAPALHHLKTGTTVGKTGAELSQGTRTPQSGRTRATYTPPPSTPATPAPASTEKGGWLSRVRKKIGL